MQLALAVVQRAVRGLLCRRGAVRSRGDGQSCSSRAKTFALTLTIGVSGGAGTRSTTATRAADAARHPRRLRAVRGAPGHVQAATSSTKPSSTATQAVVCALCASDSNCAHIRIIWLASAQAAEEKEQQAEAEIPVDDEDELMCEQNQVDFSTKSDLKTASCVAPRMICSKLYYDAAAQDLPRAPRGVSRRRPQRQEERAQHPQRPRNITMKRKDQSGALPAIRHQHHPRTHHLRTTAWYANRSFD